MPKIWIDGDACPVVIREILFKAANRTETDLTIVANQLIKIPPSKFIRSVQVQQGFDEADNEIVRRVVEGDLVITSDIPLAADSIKKGATALSSRGDQYTAENIRNRLQMRDLMESLRSSGVETGGPPALNHADRKKFADKLDQWLARKAAE